MSDGRWYNSDVFDKIIEEDKKRNEEYNWVEGVRSHIHDHMDNGIKKDFIRKGKL